MTLAENGANEPPVAGCAAARGGPRGARPSEDFSRRGAGRRQRPTRCCSRPSGAGARAPMSSSASSRRTAAPRRRRCCAAWRSFRAAVSSYARTRSSRRWISTRSWRGGRRIALVDELAHTNAPGSRHPKRYLDVEELLAAGIDVYTTLNIQHVESLNDVVAQITRDARPRDRAGFDPRPRRRHRGHRSDAGRSDPAAARGQGLCSRRRRSARSRTIFRRAT